MLFRPKETIISNAVFLVSTQATSDGQKPNLAACDSAWNAGQGAGMDQSGSVPKPRTGDVEPDWTPERTSCSGDKGWRGQPSLGGSQGST